MSKDDVKTKPGAKANDGKGPAKIKTPVVKKSEEELKSTQQGSVIYVARTAMALANTKERAGLNGNFKNSSVFSTKMNSALKTGGRIELLAETDPKFIEVRTLAKASVLEMKTPNPYGDETKKFLNYILGNLCGNKGSRGFHPGKLEGLNLG